MKKTNIVLGIVAAAVMLSACSKGNETGVTTQPQTGTVVNETDTSQSVEAEQPGDDKNIRNMVPSLTDFVPDEMYAAADRWPSCDDTALAAVMCLTMNLIWFWLSSR